MSDIATTVERYIAMWNETDAERRRALIAETVVEEASYVDPLMTGEGIDGIDAMIAAAQSQFPGHSFALVGGPDSHHEFARFSWSLGADGGEPVARGMDFATVAGDGRLATVTGFLEDGAGA